MERKIVPAKPFVKIIKEIYKGNLNESSQTVINNINNFFQNYIVDQDTRIPYSLISDLIYSDKKFYGNDIHDDINNDDLDNTVDEKMDVVDENIQILLDNVIKPNIKLQKSINKIGDHIKLSIVQSHYIRKTTMVVKVEANDVIKQKINENKVKIYTEFVSILGIFTGIIVGIMGSLQTISSVFSHIDTVSTGKLLMFSSLTSGGVITMLFLLMKWVSVIASQNFSRTSDKRSFPQLLKDNVVFSSFMLLLLSLFILGGTLNYNGVNDALQEIFDSHVFAMISIAIIPTFLTVIWVIVLVYHFIEVYNQKNDDEKNT
jgi:hypothetical protein